MVLYVLVMFGCRFDTVDCLTLENVLQQLYTIVFENSKVWDQQLSDADLGAIKMFSKFSCHWHNKFERKVCQSST